MFQQIIDDHFRAIKEPRLPDGLFHPSSMTGCDRLAVYEKTGTEKTDEQDIRNIRIMANGTRMHEEIQAMLVERFPGFIAEVEVDYEGIKGSCDGLLPKGNGVGYELQEFKSISPTAKKFMKGQPKPEHVMQARIYYWALEWSGPGYLLDGIRISYFDRDDWSVVEYEVEPWNESEGAAFGELLDNLQAHAEEGTLPPRKENGYWLCRYCQYATRCWKIDKENERG
jgi:CRISPR/Cas system-associated exonuclease Cas4 (RecB family)